MGVTWSFTFNVFCHESYATFILLSKLKPKAEAYLSPEQFSVLPSKVQHGSRFMSNNLCVCGCVCVYSLKAVLVLSL